MLRMPNIFSSAYRTPGRHWQVFNRTPFLQASHKHAAPATSAPHEPPSSPMTPLVCACIACREEGRVRQDRSKESAAVSCKRDLRNGVSELSFGHRPQLAIAADNQHQPLRGCKSISQPSHLGQRRSLSQHDIRNPLLVLDGCVAQSLVQDVAGERV